MIGSSIGNYKILEQLNGAETIKIYKAIDMLLNRNVYFKVLSKEFINQRDVTENFRHEAAILAKLVNPGIPTLHSLTTIDNELFMIIEFLDGETLDKALRRQGKFSCEQAVSTFTQILDSLEYAHNAGVVHGDLKTSRIFLTDTNSVKILGFGTSANPQIDELDGSLKPGHKLDAGNDIYEVGKIFFEILTGEKLPSDKTQEIELRLHTIKPAIPDRIVEAVTNVFRLQAYGKFQSADELRRKLLPVDLGIGLSEDSGVVRNTKFTAISDNGNAAVYSVDFSRDKNKSFKNTFRRSRSKARGESKLNNDAPVNWKLAQKNLWVAGAGVLAIVILHFFFQVSFIQNDVAQIEKGLTENNPLISVKPSAASEQIVKPEASAEIDPFGKQNNEKSVETSEDESRKNYESREEIKSKKSEIVKKPEVVTPSVQSRPNLVSPRVIIKKKEPQQQTRAERLRRAEKILTGA